VGKSALLDAFESEAQHRGIPFARLDAQDVPPQPSALREVIHSMLTPPSESASVQVLALDTVERLSALEHWLHDQLLAELPANTIVVLAGRWNPGPGWRADPATSQMLIEYELDDLPPKAAREYLARREIPAEQRQRILPFAQGHPLALALSADQVTRHPEQPFHPSGSTDVVQLLVRWLVRDVQGRYRKALRAAATVHHITEPVLAAMVGSDAEELFDWLARQHFVRWRPAGLAVHEIVRNAVIEEFRYRDLDSHHALIRRAVDHYFARTEQADPSTRHALLAEALYTVRHEPYVQRTFHLDDADYYLDEPDGTDLPALAEMVESLEGTDARRWFEHYVDWGSPWIVVRDRRAHAIGVGVAVFLEVDTLDSEQEDPAVLALRDYLLAHAPLRQGGQAALIRFGLVQATHQQSTRPFSHLQMWANTLFFAPRLSFIATAGDADLEWRGSSEYSDCHPLPGTHFSSERRRFVLIGHDLRKEPPIRWVRNCIERFLENEDSINSSRVTLTVLERPQFERAVHHALQNFYDDAQLDQSLLSHSYLMRRDGADGGPESIRRVVGGAAQQLGATPSQHSSYEVLRHAYLDGHVQKQLQAAMELGMSERTFRRRLREAERDLVEWLWEMETERG
jgi:hypothetical protein